MNSIRFFKSDYNLGMWTLLTNSFIETYYKDRAEVGLCYPQTYEEHYMRIFVKEENKHDAAVHAFEKICKTFSEKFKLDADAAVIGSPTKDRQYASQRLLSRQYSNAYS